MNILSFGSLGAPVELLQLALNRAGLGVIAQDGVFAAETQNALRRFQAANALTPDGVAGAATHRALLPYYTGFITHTVRPGDTLSALAARYGTTLAAILTANPGVNGAALTPGAALTVPLGFDVVPTDIAYSSALLGYVVRGLAARYPFISVGEIGRSVMGKPLWRLTLGTGANRALYTAAHHANEWITAPVVLKFVESLARAYAEGGELAGQRAGELLEYSTLFAVPCVDPDGVDLVTGALAAGEWYSRAEGIAREYPQFAFPRGWKANIRGVDLNLQYPAGWETARANKAALGIVSPAPADFVGASPLSAPESRALYDFTLALDPAIVLAYHTQGEVIYWQYEGYAPPGAEGIVRAFERASGYAADTAPYASAFAGFKDWVIAALDTPAFTIEAGRGLNPLPLTQFDAIYRANEELMVLGLIVT